MFENLPFSNVSFFTLLIFQKCGLIVKMKEVRLPLVLLVSLVLSFMGLLLFPFDLLMSNSSLLRLLLLCSSSSSASAWSNRLLSLLVYSWLGISDSDLPFFLFSFGWPLEAVRRANGCMISNTNKSIQKMMPMVMYKGIIREEIKSWVSLSSSFNFPWQFCKYWKKRGGKYLAKTCLK